MTKITVAPQNQPLYDRIERLENNLEVTMKALEDVTWSLRNAGVLRTPFPEDRKIR